MADGKVSISFSADMSGLNKQLEEARAKLAQFTAQAKSGATGESFQALREGAQRAVADIETLIRKIKEASVLDSRVDIEKYTAAIRSQQKLANAAATQHAAAPSEGTEKVLRNNVEYLAGLRAAKAEEVGILRDKMREIASLSSEEVRGSTGGEVKRRTSLAREMKRATEEDIKERKQESKYLAEAIAEGTSVTDRALEGAQKSETEATSKEVRLRASLAREMKRATEEAIKERQQETKYLAAAIADGTSITDRAWENAKKSTPVAVGQASFASLQDGINKAMGLDRAMLSAKSSASVFATALATQGVSAREAAAANSALGNSLEILTRTQLTSAHADNIRRQAGDRGRLQSYQWTNLSYQVNDVVSGFAMGQSPLTILAQQGGQVYQVLADAQGGVVGGLKAVRASLFALATPVTLGLGGIAVAAVAAAGYLVSLKLRADAVRDAMREMSTSVALAGRGGNFQYIDAELSRFQKRATDGTSWISGWGVNGEMSKGLKDEDAKKLGSTLATIPGASAPLLNVFAEIARVEKAAFGDEAQGHLEGFAAALADPDAAGLKFVDTLGFMSAAQREDLKAQIQHADQSGKLALVTDGLIARTRSLLAEKLRAASGYDALSEEQKQEVNLAVQQIKTGQALNANLSSVSKEASNLGKEFSLASTQMDVFSGKTKAASTDLQGLQKIAQDLALNANPLSSQLAEIDSRIQKLRAGLSATGQEFKQLGTGATGDVAELIKKFEGFQGNAKWDVNAFRAGYGSDTTTSASGEVSAVTASTQVSREDAERDLARRIAEFQKIVRAQVGEMFDGMSAQVKASLTSVAYNYGKLPTNVASAARGGNSSAIADAIQSHADDNGGINAARRESEAQNIRSAEKLNEVLGSELDRRQQIADKIAGGSALALVELDIAQKNAVGTQDEVKDEERKLAILREQLSTTHDLEARNQKSREIAASETALREKRLALAQAENQLEQAKVGASDPQKKRDLEVATATEDRGQFAPNTAGYDAANQRIVEADRTLEQTLLTMKRTAEQTKLDVKLAALAQEEQIIQEQAASEKITEQQKNDLLANVIERRQGLEKAHEEFLRDSYAKDAVAFQQHQEKLTLIDKQATIERENQQRRASLELENSYKSVFDEIGSTMHSSIMGMIQGQQKLVDAARNVTLQIISMFLQAGIKMVANHLAQVAAKTAGTVGGQAAETGATAAGVAARTGIEGAGAAAGAGAGIAKYFAQIQAAAAATYANVFAWASPIMGPLAVVPAVAASGLVIAQQALLPSFAVGAWNLPNDMVAQVHKGEMIVPAHAAGGLRSALSGGGAGQGPVAHMNLTYNAASGTSLDVVKTHAREFAKIIKDQFDRNPALRPTY